MPAPQSLPSRLIGALFVERGLVSESQIRVALEIQRETGQQLGQVLVERFGVSRKELASVVAEQWAKLGGSAGPEDTASWRRLGDIFVDRGFVTQEELDEALARQRQTGERLGEALVAQGVISKFELAGALAEQMAALGEPETEAGSANGQPEATVHQLHARDDSEPAPAAANVIDLAPPTEWGAESTEPDPQVLAAEDGPFAEDAGADEPLAARSGAIDAILSYIEPVEEPRPAEEMLAELNQALPAEEPTADEPAETAEADVEPVEEASPAVGMLTEPDDALAADAPVAAEEPVAVDEPVVVHEPVVVEEPVAELPVEHEAPEALAPHEEPSKAPWPAEVMLTEVDEALSAEVGYVESAPPVADPRTACVAFAPTIEGYKLLALEAQPEPGETIDIPDVGEYLVLRVGSSPLPGDDRRCAYVEERVTPALVGAAAH
jgi:hypothetical protein